MAPVAGEPRDVQRPSGLVWGRACGGPGSCSIRHPLQRKPAEHDGPKDPIAATLCPEQHGCLCRGLTWVAVRLVKASQLQRAHVIKHTLNDYIPEGLRSMLQINVVMLLNENGEIRAPIAQDPQGAHDLRLLRLSMSHPLW